MLRGKIEGLQVAVPFETSNLMVTGTHLKDLKFSTDIATNRLLTVGFSQGSPSYA